MLRYSFLFDWQRFHFENDFMKIENSNVFRLNPIHMRLIVLLLSRRERSACPFIVRVELEKYLVPYVR